MILKRLSDDEYVAAVRSSDLAFRRSLWVYPVMLVFNLYAIYWFATNFYSLLEASKEGRPALVGFVAGVVYGAGLVALSFGTIACLVEWSRARTGYRKDRLLMKYYDELQSKNTSNKANSANAEDGVADL